MLISPSFFHLSHPQNLAPSVIFHALSHGHVPFFSILFFRFHVHTNLVIFLMLFLPNYDHFSPYENTTSRLFFLEVSTPLDIIFHALSREQHPNLSFLLLSSIHIQSSCFSSYIYPFYTCLLPIFPPTFFPSLWFSHSYTLFFTLFLMKYHPNPPFSFLHVIPTQCSCSSLYVHYILITFS